jgi:hypothetical protein
MDAKILSVVVSYCMGLFSEDYTLANYAYCNTAKLVTKHSQTPKQRPSTYRTLPRRPRNLGIEIIYAVSKGILR